MRPLVWSVFASSLALVTCSFAAAPKTHRELRSEADAAYQRKDYTAAHDGYATALALRPDSPRYHHNLAATAVLLGKKTEALETLKHLAALGVVTRVATDRDFSPLQGTPEFAEILQQLEAHRAPRGSVESIADLPSQTGIVEGIAWRERTDDLFLGDVHRRCIWRRDRAGTVTRFTVDDEEVLGVFGLVVDEKRRALWAATSALPEMSGFTTEFKGQAGLAEFDLASGELRRVLPVPGDAREHVLGDLVLAPDGAIYLTDSAAPVIWQFAPGGDKLTKLVESPAFFSLQGIALGGRTLLVSDYANGLFTIDLATQAVRALPPPENSTLLGVDGLVAVSSGVVAVQNGVIPQRILKISFSPDTTKITGVEVLAAALPGLDDLTLITTVRDRLAVIAASGWDGFNPEKAPHPAAHTVRLFGVTPR